MKSLFNQKLSIEFDVSERRIRCLVHIINIAIQIFLKALKYSDHSAFIIEKYIALSDFNVNFDVDCDDLIESIFEGDEVEVDSLEVFSNLIRRMRLICKKIRSSNSARKSLVSFRR